MNEQWALFKLDFSLRAELIDVEFWAPVRAEKKYDVSINLAAGVFRSCSVCAAKTDSASVKTRNEREKKKQKQFANFILSRKHYYA